MIRHKIRHTKVLLIPLQIQISLLWIQKYCSTIRNSQKNIKNTCKEASKLMSSYTKLRGSPSQLCSCSICCTTSLLPVMWQLSVRVFVCKIWHSFTLSQLTNTLENMKNSKTNQLLWPAFSWTSCKSWLSHTLISKLTPSEQFLRLHCSIQQDKQYKTISWWRGLR